MGRNYKREFEAEMEWKGLALQRLRSMIRECHSVKTMAQSFGLNETTMADQLRRLGLLDAAKEAHRKANAR